MTEMCKTCSAVYEDDSDWSGPAHSERDCILKLKTIIDRLTSERDWAKSDSIVMSHERNSAQADAFMWKEKAARAKAAERALVVAWLKTEDLDDAARYIEAGEHDK